MAVLLTLKNREMEYTMIDNVGVWDEKTKKGYHKRTITDEVAKRLIKRFPDKILTVKRYKELGGPNYAEYLEILKNEKKDVQQHGTGGKD